MSQFPRSWPKIQNKYYCIVHTHINTNAYGLFLFWICFVPLSQLFYYELKSLTHNHTYEHAHTPLVTDKCFPTVPTCRRLQASDTQTHTHSLTLRQTWQRQILLDASIKRKSLCFVSTVAVVQPNSSILSSSISHGCEIREMETAFAAQSKKIFKVSSWGF